VLERPAQHHLCRCSLQAFGDLDNRRMLESSASLERAVGLKHDIVVFARLEQPSAETERAELRLVHSRPDRRVRDEPAK